MNQSKIKKFIISLRPGQEIISQIKKFCQKQKINNAFFYGIGAVDFIQLAHYSVADKKYSAFSFKEPLELVSLIGNVFPDDQQELIVHGHAVCGRPNGETVAGHLVKGYISGVGEIILEQLSSQLKKTYDPQTGLKVLKTS